MVLNFINGLIPKPPSLEGFQPSPSQGANEFMSMQGAQMALGFGAYYTIGKRMIAKLDNEDFNAMLKNPEHFQSYLQPHYEAIQDNFENHLASNRYMKIQEQIISAGIHLEKRKLEENIKLIQWMLGKLAESGLTGIDALATALGIDTSELRKWYSQDNAPITNNPTNAPSSTPQNPYIDPNHPNQQQQQPKEEPQNQLYTIALKYPQYTIRSYGTNKYSTKYLKEVSFQYTGTEKQQALYARSLLAKVKSSATWLNKKPPMGQMDAKRVATAKTYHAHYQVTWNWYYKMFKYLPTEGELKSRGFL